ncbi:MAG: hypothetical protein Q9210_005621 [Variospora velana]
MSSAAMRVSLNSTTKQAQYPPAGLHRSIMQVVLGILALGWISRLCVRAVDSSTAFFSPELSAPSANFTYARERILSIIVSQH